MVAISFAAIFFRKAFPTHPMVAAGIRLAIAAAILLPIAARRYRAGLVTPRVLRTAAVGGLLYGIHFGTWVTSLSLTSVAASVTLVTATPLMLAVVALYTGKDRPDRRLWVALSLALVGVLVIGGADLSVSGDALLGDALALAGAAAMAAYLILGRRLGDELDVWSFSAVATAVGAVSMLVPAAAMGISLVPSSDEALFYLLLAALIPQLIGHTLLTWSLRYATPTAVGIATVGEPIGSTALGYVWLGEAVSAQTLVGCGITLAAVLIAVTRRRV